MMDSGSGKEFDAGTAGINDAQVEWYNWNMNAFEAKCGEKPTRKPAKGGAVTSFAVGLWDQKVLEKLIERRMDAKLLYHLGNLHYDRRNYDTAARCWTEAAALDPANAAVHRNLALYRYNKKKDSASALRSMEKAFALAGDDSRMLLELSQLYSACGKSRSGIPSCDARQNANRGGNVLQRYACRLHLPRRAVPRSAGRNRGGGKDSGFLCRLRRRKQREAREDRLFRGVVARLAGVGT